MKRWFLLCGLVITMMAMVAFWVSLPPKIVRGLPDQADDVQWKEYDLFPDSAFILSARLDEARCRAHVATYEELAPYDSAALERDLGEQAMWGDWFASAESWWNPAAVGTATWVWHSEDGGAWKLAQCSNGRLYYDEHTH